MEYDDLIKKRYSVRHYLSRPVEKEKLEKVLEAAQLAPTAVNKQPFRFIVIETEGKEDILKQIYPANWFTEAPLVICACTIPSQAWTRRDGKCYVEVDTTIAMDHLILAATNQGLGTCWIAAFDVRAAKKILNIPEGVEPLLFTPLGYPADEIGEKSRKTINEIVYSNKWE
jgi:nitroreductase